MNHTDLQKSRIQKDEEAVNAVTTLIKNWVDPFANDQDLLSISTAPKDVSHDLLNAYDIGQSAYEAFKSERLENDPPEKKFHDQLKTARLKTFSDLCKKKEVNSNGRIAILKADRSLFGRIIVMAQSRNLRMEYILAHPLGPLPWALATPDGLLRKTNKASLATTLQKNVKLADAIPDNSTAVIDGMALVQRIKGDERTYGDIAKNVFSMALGMGIESQRIDVVFDCYIENSTKNNERRLHGEQTGHQLKSITDSQIVRQWRKFLGDVDNKNNLIAFLVDQWKKPEYRARLDTKVLYATVKDICYKISSQNTEMESLRCSQEEADGRLLLHAAHASRDEHSTVVICSDDTDVFVMALAFHNEIHVNANLYQRCGQRTRVKLIDIQKVASTIGIDTCKALVGMHAFTGCDTVSAFAGKGKTNALKLLMNHNDFKNTFLELGREWDLSQSLVERLELFTCRLYASKVATNRVDDLRYNIFCAKRGEVESHQLPPCSDCLRKHCQRANYQAAIWRKCLQQDPEVPSPVGRGWKLEKENGKDRLVVHWMEGQPAPDSVLDLLSCNCSRQCALPNCPCLINGLKCTDMCKLTDCTNQETISYSDNEDNDNDLDDDL